MAKELAALIDPRGWRVYAILGMVALALLGTGLLGSPREVRAESSQRSIVVVLVDTLRADRLGAYGYTARDTSPRIDALAAEGVVFENAFAPAGWTVPSVASLLTAQYPDRHGAGIMRRESNAAHVTGVDPRLPTLTDALSANGYATAGVSANPAMTAELGLDRGFEHFARIGQNWNELARGRHVTREALRWLDARGGDERPFFLMVHYVDPHIPYVPSKHARGRFTAGLEAHGQYPVSYERLEHVETAEQRAFVAAAYDEEVLSVDRQVGRLVDGLRARGVLDDAVVLLTSDHGEELFEHGSYGHGHSLHDELLRVPLVVRGPDIGSGRVTAPVSLVDVAPTLLDMVGLGRAIPPKLAGLSLRGQLAGAGAPAGRTLLASRTLWGLEQRAVVRWPWKLIAPDGSRPRLYHLERDRGEHTDLATVHTDVAVSLAGSVRLVPGRLAAQGREAEMTQRLVALGYLQTHPTQR